MIKRFHQLNESVSGLKDLDFFKDYFIDLLDEYEYKIEIEKQRYVKINQEDNIYYGTDEQRKKYIYSNFAKKDFYPCYELSLQSSSGKGFDFYSSNDIKRHSEICKILSDCISGIENNSELKIIERIECSGRINPFIKIKIADIYEIPEEELPNQLFEQLLELVKDIISRMYSSGSDSYNTLFKVIPNPDKLKIELVGNCRVNQLDAILREFSKHNKYAEKERRYSDILIFDINVIQRKHNDNHVDITNPRIVKNTIT